MLDLAFYEGREQTYGKHLVLEHFHGLEGNERMPKYGANHVIEVVDGPGGRR